MRIGDVLNRLRMDGIAIARVSLRSSGIGLRSTRDAGLNLNGMGLSVVCREGSSNALDAV